MTNFSEKYKTEVVPALMEEHGIKNSMAVPRITKIVVNMGTKDVLKDKHVKDQLMTDFAAITGQKPKIQQAHTSIAGFALRKGQPVGLTVTLRGKRMWAFLEKFVGIVLPRLRDFRGVPVKSFDQHGNYTLGFPEYSVFPEIDITKVNRKQGLEVTIVMNAKDAKISRRLLTLMGMPFEKED